MNLKALERRYKISGSFYLGEYDQVSNVVREKRVPNKYGIYFIFKGRKCEGKPVYIGMAGTMKQNGKMKQQGLAERLKAKQGKLSRDRFFTNYINDKSPKGLSFAWFVTFEKKSVDLPALAEARAIQDFYKKYKRLPDLNKTYKVMQVSLIRIKNPCQYNGKKAGGETTCLAVREFCVN